MNPQTRRTTELIFLVVFALQAFVLVPLECAASGFASQLRCFGDFYLRQPSGVRFTLLNPETRLSENSILTVPASAENPLASDSYLMLGSHTLVCYPGTTIKILSDSITPVLGRLEIISKGSSEPLRIQAKKYSGEILDGNLLVEVTPDSGTFVAMRGKGDAWFKDLSRQIFALNSGSQLHFPLFGPTREESIGSFWSEPPSSFSSARRKITPLKSAKISTEESSGLNASDSDNFSAEESEDERQLEPETDLEPESDAVISHPDQE